MRIMNYHINRHLPDFRCTFTIEFDVKFPTVTVPEDLWEYENQTYEFTNKYAEKCFKKIKRGGYSWIEEWSFTGRSGGWFVLLCYREVTYIRTRTLNRITTIVQDFYNNYDKEMRKYYKVNTYKNNL